jgi:hypothetical protein
MGALIRRGGAAAGAEVGLRCRVWLLLAAMPRGCSLDTDVGGVDVGRARARLAAERAVALVEVGAPRRGDPDFAAEAGEGQHGANHKPSFSKLMRFRLDGVCNWPSPIKPNSKVYDLTN